MNLGNVEAEIRKGTVAFNVSKLPSYRNKTLPRLFHVYGQFRLHVCLCSTCMPGAQGSQKKKLESRTVVSHLVGAGNQRCQSSTVALENGWTVVLTAWLL